MLNSLMNFAWPVKELLNFLFNTILEDSLSTEINIEELEKEIRANSFCNLKDLTLNASGLNKRLFKASALEVLQGTIGNIYIKFPKTYLKDQTEIRISNLDLEVAMKTFKSTKAEDFQLRSNTEKKTKVDLPIPIQKIINNVVNNVIFEVNNLSVCFNLSNDERIKIISRKISYGKFKDNTKDSLFIFNKQICIDNFLIAIDDDKNRFDHSEYFKCCNEGLDGLHLYHTKENVIAVINQGGYTSNNSITFKFTKGDNQSLDIEANFGKVESIANISQLQSIKSFISSLHEVQSNLNTILMRLNSNAVDIEPRKKGVPMNLFGFVVNNVKLRIRFEFINVVLLETYSILNKPRIWLFYQDYFKKFYLHENYTTNVHLISKHLCYTGENFLLCHVDNITSQIEVDLSTTDYMGNLNFNELIVKYFEPNSYVTKKKMIVINNVIATETEKVLDDLFSKQILNVIQHSYDHLNLIQVSSKEKCFSLHKFSNIETITNLNFVLDLKDILVDVNPLMILKIANCLKNRNQDYKSNLNEIIFNLNSVRDDIPQREQSCQNCNDILYHVESNFNLHLKFFSNLNGSHVYKQYYENKLNNRDHRFKLGDNSTHEHFLVNLNSINMRMFADMKTAEVLLSMSSLFILYFEYNIYFPLLIYRNSNCEEFINDPKSNSLLSIKYSYSQEEGSGQMFNDLKHCLNSLQCNAKDNFINNEIKANTLSVMNQMNTNGAESTSSSSQVNINLRLSRVDCFCSYSQLKSVCTYGANLIYSYRTLSLILNEDHSINKDYIYFNMNLKVNEVNLIGFTNIKYKLYEQNISDLLFYSDDINFTVMTSSLNLVKHLSSEERIFSMIDNPFLKIQIINLDSTLLGLRDKKDFSITTLDNVKVMARKNDNIYHDDKIKHQIFFQGIYEEENFDYILHKGCEYSKEQRHLVTLLSMRENDPNAKKSKFLKCDLSLSDLISGQEITNKTLKTNVCINDIIFCPLYRNMEESIRFLEEIKRNNVKLKLLNNKSGSRSNCKTENLIYAKPYSQVKNVNNVNFRLNITRMVIDLFSQTNKSKPNDMTEKMRIITEIQNIKFEDDRNNLLLNNGSLSSNTVLVIQEFIPPTTFALNVSSINSIFLKNLDFNKAAYGNLINKCDHISREDSIWRKMGYVEIVNIEDIRLIITQIITSTSKNKTNTNFKAEFVINSVQFYFCRDSFELFCQFVLKCKQDYESSLVSIVNQDNDNHSVLTELELIHDKQMTSNINFKTVLKGQEANDGIEFKTVGTSSNHRVKKANNYMTVDLSSSVHEKRSNSAKGRVKKVNSFQPTTFYSDKDEDQISEKAQVFDPIENEEPASIPTEKLNLFFIVNSFKCSLLDGEDFNFQGRYDTRIVDLDMRKPLQVIVIDDYFTNESNTKSTSKCNQLRECYNPRNYNNYLAICVDYFEGKFFYYDNSPIVFSHLLEIKSIIIEDGVKDSKFKKMLAKFEFENEDQIFTLKFDLLRDKKKELDVNLYIQLAPLNFFLDQLTLKFLLEYFGLQLDHSIHDIDIREDIQDLQDKESSSLSHSQIISQIPTKEMIPSKLPRSAKNINAKRIIVQEFFINICYNSRDYSLANVKTKRIMDLINISSVNDLRLEFKDFDFLGHKNIIDLIGEVYNFWKEDILKNQLVGAYLSSITLIRPFKNIVGGMLDIFRQPYTNFIEDKSIPEGIVIGLRQFITIFTTEFALLGEQIYNLLKGLFGTYNKEQTSIYKQIVYAVNNKKQVRDDFFLK